MAMKMETGERNLSSTWWKTSPAPSGRHEVPLKRQRCLCHVVNSRVQPSVGVRLPISFHLKNLGGMKLRARRSTACKKGKSYPKWSLASGSLRESIAHAPERGPEGCFFVKFITTCIPLCVKTISSQLYLFTQSGLQLSFLFY